MNKGALLVHGVGMTLLTILLAEMLFLSFAAAAAYGYPMPFITPVVEREGSATITAYRGDLPYFIGLGILASAPLSYGLRRVFKSAWKGYVYGAAAILLIIISVGVTLPGISACAFCKASACANVLSCGAESGLFYAKAICTCA